MFERNGKISHVFFHKSGAVFMVVQPVQLHRAPCLEVSHIYFNYLKLLS